MAQALWWWLVAQAVALCALPLGLALFHPLADRGYGLAKPFGLLLFGYVTWLLASTPLFPNVLWVHALALALILTGSALVVRRAGPASPYGAPALLAFWRRRRGLLLLEEGVFLGAFLGFLAVRAYNADIAGTEKFMDFAFLNAVTRSAHFPPLDPWLAPSPTVPDPSINYYYFGYLIQGLLLQLANVVPGAVHPAVGFNLALGLLFALAAVASFSLAYGLARDLVAERTPPPSRGASLATGVTTGAGPVWSLRAAWPFVAAGLLASYLLLVAGNLWTALRLLDGSGMWSRDFWQGIGWNATRVLVIRDGERDVDYTINEFPAFSFLLGDLHPHVLALPFALLAVGLAYRWLMAPPRLYRWTLGVQAAGDPSAERGARGRSPRNKKDSLLSPPTHVGVPGAIAELLPGALILGSLAFLNSWDFPAYFLLAQAGALAGAWWQRRHAAPAIPISPVTPDAEAGSSDVGRGTWDVGLRTIGAVALVGALSVVAVAPFLLTFRAPVVAEAGGLPLGLVVQRSQLGQFLQFWGAQLLLLAPALLAAGAALGLPPVLGRALSVRLDAARAPAVVARPEAFPAAPNRDLVLVLGGGVLLVLLAERLQAGTLLLALGLACGAGWVAWRCLASGMAGMGRPMAFAAGAVALGALLLAGCEVVHIRDIYGGALRRMNTVFKLYYQAWLLFAVGGSVAAFWLLRRLSPRRGRERTQAGGAGRGRTAWRVAVGAGAVLLLATALFPYKATLLRTESFRNRATLNGMDWLRQAHPDDYAAAEWLRLNAAGGATRAPVVLEASGGPYSEFARVSTQTGFPTVLGWDQHQRLWRGEAIEAEVTRRQRDVDAIYTAATLDAARPLLDTYGVAYVVVGYLERQKYGAGGGLAKFDSPGVPGGDPSGGQIVFRQGQTVIYRTASRP